MQHLFWVIVPDIDGVPNFDKEDDICYLKTMQDECDNDDACVWLDRRACMFSQGAILVPLKCNI